MEQWSNAFAKSYDLQERLKIPFINNEDIFAVLCREWIHKVDDDPGESRGVKGYQLVPVLLRKRYFCKGLPSKTSVFLCIYILLSERMGQNGQRGCW